VLGQRVAVAPGTIEVDVVTEDVTPQLPVKYAFMGAGSGHITSSNTISYANARAGIGTVTPVVPAPAPGMNYLIGQAFGSGPIWEVYEAFFWFDTSSIPVGATILKASFAAVIDTGHAGSTSLQPFTIELRSGYSWARTTARVPVLRPFRSARHGTRRTGLTSRSGRTRARGSPARS
jgi:hypothetical protein